MTDKDYSECAESPKGDHPRSNALYAERCELSRHPDLDYLQEFIEQLDAALSGLPSGDEPGRADAEQYDPVQCGANLFGRFTLRKRLGDGGFGMVFLAFDPNLGRDIALKIPRPEILLSEELRRRFVHEGRAAASLSHPNILPVYEAGEIGGIGYIVSEYCQGQTLAEWMRDGMGRISSNCAAAIVQQLASGVHHAHQRGILHRDVKPSNVLMDVSRGGTPADQTAPRLTDFGLAKRIAEVGQHSTIGVQPGTPRYMAPEQLGATSNEVGVYTDVYALGVVLYELLTGMVPFDSADHTELARGIREDEPRGLHSGVPRDLATVCLKCLAKSPVDRYGSAQELGEDLTRYLAGAEVMARPLGITAKWLRRCRRHPLVATLCTLLLAALISGIGGIAYQWHRAALYATRLESNLVKAEQELTNWAWVFEESQTLGYSNDITQIATRERLRRHYASLLNDPVEKTASTAFQATRHAFAARLALLDDDHASAERHLTESLSQWQSLMADESASYTHSRSMAATLYLHGVLFRKTQRYEQPLAQTDGDPVLFAALLKSDSRRGTVCAQYARLLIERGDALSQLSRSAESLHAYRAASRLWDQLAAMFPANRDFKFCNAECRLAEATRARERREPGEGVQTCREAETIVESLLRQDENNLDYKLLLAHLRQFLGNNQVDKSLPDATIYFESVRALLQAQESTNRRSGVLANLRISTSRRLGDLYQRAGQPQLAIERYAESTTLAHPLALARQISRENAERLGESHRTLGDLYSKLGETDHALREWKHACHVYDNPLIGAKSNLERDLAWAHCLEQIGKAEQQRDELDNAAIAFYSARGILEQHISRNPDRYSRIQKEITELEGLRIRVTEPGKTGSDVPIRQQTIQP